MREKLVKLIGLLLIVGIAGSGGGYITYQFLEKKLYI